MSTSDPLPPYFFSHPEIESAFPPAETLPHYDDLNALTTSIDVLELYHERQDYVFERRLDHDALLGFLTRASVTRGPNSIGEGDQPTVLVIFVNFLSDRDEHLHREAIMMQPRTMQWLQRHFGISNVFTDCILDPHIVKKTGDYRSVRHHTRGSSPVKSMCGSYRHGNILGTTNVWFSYDLDLGTSVYVMSVCPEPAKRRILQAARSGYIANLCEPFALDTYVADVKSWELFTLMADTRRPLIRYERENALSKNMSGQEIEQAYFNLHSMSQDFHVQYEDIVDWEERTKFLRETKELYDKTLATQQPVHTELHHDSVLESLNFLLSRSAIWKRWTDNYKARTVIRINLYLNLAMLKDSETNLNIAVTSKRIAEESRKDSLSMITIAAITMAFLPATFVTGLFSMVFFNIQTDGSGTSRLTTDKQIWIYFVVAIPLTIFVFIIWALWRRNREVKSANLGSAGSATGLLQRLKHFDHHPRGDPDLSVPRTEETSRRIGFFPHRRPLMNADGEKGEALFATNY